MSNGLRKVRVPIFTLANNHGSNAVRLVRSKNVDVGTAPYEWNLDLTFRIHPTLGEDVSDADLQFLPSGRNNLCDQGQ